MFKKIKVLHIQVQVYHLSSSAQLVNVFTKAVSNARLLHMRDKFSVTLAHPEFEGGC